jgi:hypothetical protein
MLREGIDRITEQASVPDGLLERARRHRRRQRTAIGGAAFGATAVAGAAAVAASGLAGSGPRPASTLHAQTTAYVVKHAERALSAATGGTALEEIHTTARNAWFTVITHPRTGGVTLPLNALGSSASASQLNVWAYRGRLRQQGLTAGGQLVFDADRTTVTSPAGLRTSSGTGASYSSRTWWHAVSTAGAAPAGTSPPSCLTTSLAPPTGGATDWSAQIHEALACGLFRIAGTQQVDGTGTVKLVAARPQPGPAGVRQTLWVNPATYLPVRVSWVWPDGQHQGSLVGDFRWLPPSPARLRLLTTPVPAGFRQVKPAGLPQPTFAFIEVPSAR